MCASDEVDDALVPKSYTRAMSTSQSNRRAERLRLNQTEFGNTAFPPLLLKFWAWISALTALSLAYTLTMTYVFKAGFPYGLPLLANHEPYSDFTIFSERFLHFRSPSFWDTFNYPFTYPAPTALVFELFYKIPHPTGVFLATCSATAMLAACALAVALVRRGISPALAISFTLTSLLTSWPLGLLLNRGNIEGIVAIVLAIGVLAVLYEHCWLGATLIGVAGAMKLFPFVLLALLLSKRRYKEFAWGALVGILATVGSLEVLGPNLTDAQHHISAGLKYFESSSAATLLRTEIGFDHSLFSLVKFVMVFINGYLHHIKRAIRADGAAPTHLVDIAGPLLAVSLKWYLGITALAGIAAYFIWIRKLPLLNQTLALTICAVLLPPVSFDYTLVQLVLPFGLLCLYTVDIWRKDNQVRGLKASFACLSVIFTAEAYFTLVIRLAGQVRAVVLLILLVTVMRCPFPWQALGEEEQETDRKPLNT